MTDLGSCDIGALPMITAEFTDVRTGNLIDPENVFFEWEPQGGAKTIYTFGVSAQLGRTGLGQFYALVDTSAADGLYVCRFYATGNGQSAEIGQFNVIKNPVI